MPGEREQKPHFTLDDRWTTTARYTAKGQPPRLKTPARNRAQHGHRILGELNAIRDSVREMVDAAERLDAEAPESILLEFRSGRDFDLKIESLDLRGRGIELLNVREIEGITHATVLVPLGQVGEFIRRVEAYLTQDTEKSKQPKNRELVESIESVRIAALDALWTDEGSPLPADDDLVWWEVWLRKPEDGIAPARIEAAARRLGIQIGEERLEFPERSVVAVRATKNQLAQSVALIDMIAELKRVKRTPEYYVELRAAEQRELVENLLARCTYSAEAAVAVCLLDTGVNRGHPLLQDAIRPQDALAYDDAWGGDDSDRSGHGTGMAGVALFGDLVDSIENGDAISLEHAIESVKILPPVGGNPPHLYGRVTIDSVNKAEANAPDRQRVIAMAVTSDDLDMGRPSTWSSAVDALASGAYDGQKRLMLISAGNTSGDTWNDFPNCCRVGVEDPGQAWNALTIGAFTEKTRLSQDFQGWDVVADAGNLSPYSRTSVGWPRPWPIKPEVFFEGGNCAIDPNDGSASDLDALSLLTTNRDPARPFAVFNQTSAATAMAGRFAAQLQLRYPTLWPETIRALIVHSADWTDAMLAPVQPLLERSRQEREAFVRFCGFGVPNFERACWSASSEVTLISQQTLQPFGRSDHGGIVNDKINYHRLPWPRDVLTSLGAEPVELRATLSYFVEPNPGSRGWKGRYRYASHALRFEVKKPGEDEELFKRRVNKYARLADADEEDYGEVDRGWLLGPYLRHLGSLNADRWYGRAADLADLYMFAVYPVMGWWKRPSFHRWDSECRYSLVISIVTPSQTVDVEVVNIYDAIENQVAIGIEVEGENGEGM